MGELSSGQFFGVTDQRLDTNGLILTNTDYTHDYVDWHHHQNAYFTFILSGAVMEGSKKGKVNLYPGSLLYHNAQESHYNIKPKGYTRGMHLEIETSWFDEMYAIRDLREDSFEITAQKTKLLFYKILKESKMADDTVKLGIQDLVIQAMDSFSLAQSTAELSPSWISEVNAYLQDNYLSPIDLKVIANVVGVHPVHLSRSFSKYFGTTMSQYVRGIKVERALSKLSVKTDSLSAIAHQCGFADQSHMVRCFKEISGETPSFFRKLINSLPAC